MERESLTAALAPGPECLPLEQLGRYADGVLPPDAQAAAGSHVRGCLNCQAELALLPAVTSDHVRAGEAAVVRDGVARLEKRVSEIFDAGGTPPPSPRRASRLGLVSAAALAAVVLVVAGRFYRPSDEVPELPLGVTTGDETTRSLALTVRGPLGDQAESPRRFEWLAVEGAVRYRVRLMEVDRREVWSASTPALALELPSSIRTQLAPGRTLLWDVTAYDASDAVIAESGTQAFRLVLG